MSLSILLVDDIEVNLMVASLMLKNLGYHADLAKNGVEAIEALEQQSYDIVFMDIEMPEMDGLEATKIIRQRRNQSPKIIITTSLNNYRDACLDAGADDFLTKPLKIETLRAAIEYYYPIRSFNEFISSGLEEITAACDLCAMETSPSYVV
jgi:CheY-like chemotaxis protein